jgi:hypothetical protein
MNSVFSSRNGWEMSAVEVEMKQECMSDLILCLALYIDCIIILSDWVLNTKF